MGPSWTGGAGADEAEDTDGADRADGADGAEDADGADSSSAVHTAQVRFFTVDDSLVNEPTLDQFACVHW